MRQLVFLLVLSLSCGAAELSEKEKTERRLLSIDLYGTALRYSRNWDLNPRKVDNMFFKRMEQAARDERSMTFHRYFMLCLKRARRDALKTGEDSAFRLEALSYLTGLAMRNGFSLPDDFFTTEECRLLIGEYDKEFLKEEEAVRRNVASFFLEEVEPVARTSQHEDHSVGR